MNICYCFGPNWAKYIPIELHSLFSNNEVDKVYLMSERMPPDIMDTCKRLCSSFSVDLTYFDMRAFEQTHIKTNKNVDTRFTKYTLYRLGIPDFIKDDKVLYLDSDTLVLGDISELYNIELGENIIAGAIDTGISDDHIKAINGQLGTPYLNAGVLLMDLKKLREMDITKKWLSMMNKTHYPAHDQDIIFLTLAGKFKIVEPIYNCSLSTAYNMPDEDVRILHLAGDKSRNWIYSLPKANLWTKAEKKYSEYVSKEKNKLQRINKIIAYAWFGRGKKPQKIQECIDSWKKVSPDWEIIELNEDNCDVEKLQFTSEAYRLKKYAFVADYFRLEAMYNLGCITLDADVELLKPLDDFLHHRMFSGQEVDDQVLITATMGAEKGHPVVKQLMKYYSSTEFNADYKIPNTKWITAVFNKLIEKKDKDKLILYNDVHLYPKYYFCNYDHKRLKIIADTRSYAIHWFNGSWK